MAKAGGPYYRADLALVHHLGFAFHAADCAPGILELLEPVRERDGLVVELGCGSGHLQRGRLWRRDDERDVNVLINTARVRPFLADHGVRATIGGVRATISDSFGGGVELLTGAPHHRGAQGSVRSGAATSPR